MKAPEAQARPRRGTEGTGEGAATSTSKGGREAWMLGAFGFRNRFKGLAEVGHGGPQHSYARPVRQVPSARSPRQHQQMTLNRYSLLDHYDRPLATCQLPRHPSPLPGSASRARNEPPEHRTPVQFLQRGAQGPANGVPLSRPPLGRVPKILTEAGASYANARVKPRVFSRAFRTPQIRSSSSPRGLASAGSKSVYVFRDGQPRPHRTRGRR